MPDRLTGQIPSGRMLIIATGHDLSLALVRGGVIEAEMLTPMARGHAEALVPAIAELLEKAGRYEQRCDIIAVETGPGSFTGLRVGLAAARALGIAWGATVVGIRSTQLVAADVRRAGYDGRLLVGLAAPRGQIWIQAFEEGGLQSLGEPQAVDLAEFRDLAERYPQVAGTAALEPPIRFQQITPRAASAAGLSMSAFGKAEPLYVRSSDNVGP